MSPTAPSNPIIEMYADPHVGFVGTLVLALVFRDLFTVLESKVSTKLFSLGFHLSLINVNVFVKLLHLHIMRPN